MNELGEAQMEGSRTIVGDAVKLKEVRFNYETVFPWLATSSLGLPIAPPWLARGRIDLLSAEWNV